METHMGTHFKGAEKARVIIENYIEFIILVCIIYLMKNFYSEKLEFYAKHMRNKYACNCGKTFRSKGFFDRHINKCDQGRPFIHKLPVPNSEPIWVTGAGRETFLAGQTGTIEHKPKTSIEERVDCE